MLRDDAPVELPITAEFVAQRAEGKRRQRAHEGIDFNRLSTVGGCVGTHKLPSIEEVERFWTEEGSFEIYPHDPEGLARELRDLERDAENLLMHLSVDYGEAHE